MWMAWDRYQKTGRGDQVNVDFYTGTPSMFGVKKYSDILEKMRVARGVGGFFQHNLTAIDTSNRKATFKKVDNSEEVKVDYTILHVVPPMGPLKVVKESPLADEAGWVAVDQATLRSTKFDNVWSLGDASSLPTSKTAAAITSQAPVLTENLFQVMDSGLLGTARYDGYTSCPVRDVRFVTFSSTDLGCRSFLPAMISFCWLNSSTVACQKRRSRIGHSSVIRVFPGSEHPLMLHSTQFR